MREGRFIVERKEIEGLSPKEIARKLALPENSRPTHVMEVTLPQGTRLRTGVLNSEIMSGNGQNVLQFEILETPESGWFKVSKELK